MTYQWEELEEELSKITGEYIVIHFHDNENQVYIGQEKVIKFKQKNFQQYKDTRDYFVKKLKKYAPEYLL